MEAILLVGGQGTRLSPLTLTTPKPMLPVANIPFTAHQIAKAKAAGITKIILSTSYKAEVFAQYFADGANFGIEIQYVTESSPLGTGGAIRNVFSALESKGSDPVFIFNGDILSGHSLEKQLGNFQQHEAAVSLHLIEVADPRPYGLVPTDAEGFVKEFLEKPTQDSQIITNQVNAGCYIFRSEVIESIKPDSVVSVEREVFPELLKNQKRIVGYVENSYWLDLGTPASYLKGNIDTVTGVCHSPLITNPGQVLIADGVQIAATAKISGGSCIGPNSTIAENVEINNSVVMAGATINANSKIENSIIGKDVIVESAVNLIDVVVADGAKIATSPPIGVKIANDGQFL